MSLPASAPSFPHFYRRLNSCRTIISGLKSFIRSTSMFWGGVFSFILSLSFHPFCIFIFFIYHSLYLYSKSPLPPPPPPPPPGICSFSQILFLCFLLTLFVQHFYLLGQKYHGIRCFVHIFQESSFFLLFCTMK